MWQQAKEIIRKCLTSSLHNQTPLPAERNLNGTQKNEIWHMGMFILQNLES